MRINTAYTDVVFYCIKIISIQAIYHDGDRLATLMRINTAYTDVVFYCIRIISVQT